ncbi:MAG: LuxR C-terminal-related transcriptional regulator [Spirochaetaceae bacterium]
MKENNIIYSRIKKEYNIKVLIREIILFFLIFIFHLSFPTAFDVIQYPFYFMMALVLTSIIIYLPVLIKIKQLMVDFDSNLKQIVKIDKYYFLIGNLTIAILMPAFGSQFVNIFWFITVINCCIIFVSPFQKRKYIYPVFLSPITSVIIHYLIYFPQGKSFQLIEICFAGLMSFLLYYTYSNISQKKLYNKILFNEEEVMSKFCSSKKLTDREQDVLTAMLEGKSTKQIGQKLYISPGTARNHISNIFQKTDTHSRMELFSEFNRLS